MKRDELNQMAPDMKNTVEYIKTEDSKVGDLKELPHDTTTLSFTDYTGSGVKKELDSLNYQGSGLKSELSSLQAATKRGEFGGGHGAGQQKGSSS